MRKDCAFTQSSKPGWCHLEEGYVVFAVRAGISWMNVLWEVRWESAWTPSSSQALLLLFPMAALLIFPSVCFGVFILCTVLSFQHFHKQCDLSELRMCLLWSWKVVGKAVDLCLKEVDFALWTDSVNLAVLCYEEDLWFVEILGH